MSEQDDQARREAIFDALNLKTPLEWNMDPRNKYRIQGWTEFNPKGMPEIGLNDRITWQQFKARRDATECSMIILVPFDQLTEDD